MNQARTIHGDTIGVNTLPDGIRPADSQECEAACYQLMKQLRPHLLSEDEFIDRLHRQVAAGYRLVALWREGQPLALAGYRVQENLMHGLHLYVDDLVTDETERSNGYGHDLIEYLKAEGRALGCCKLLLDTALDNVRGHRFYYCNDLFATALRFSVFLGGPANGSD